jgi:hypothetical protein
VDCDTDEALAAGARFEPSPSLVIASGGLTASGQRKVHDYWRLAMHVDGDMADAALKRLQRHLGSDPRCAEAARVLRPIGTTWRKDGLVRPVELLHVDLSAVYPIDVVLDGTEALPTPEPPRQARIRALGNGSHRLDALEAALKGGPAARLRGRAHRARAEPCGEDPVSVPHLIRKSSDPRPGFACSFSCRRVRERMSRRIDEFVGSAAVGAAARVLRAADRVARRAVGQAALLVSR